MHDLKTIIALENQAHQEYLAEKAKAQVELLRIIESIIVDGMRAMILAQPETKKGEPKS